MNKYQQALDLLYGFAYNNAFEYNKVEDQIKVDDAKETLQRALKELKAYKESDECDYD